MTRREHTAGVLGLAVGLRLVVVLYASRHFPAGWFFTRGQEMSLLANSLLQGHGLASPFGPDTGPTAILGPGYPAVVAAVFALGGSGTACSALLLMLVNLGANIVTVALVLHVARRFAPERAAVAAGLFWACSPPLLWMPTICWETSFSCCLLLGVVALALHLGEGGAGPAGWLATGGVCALAGWMNPSLLPCVLAVCAVAAVYAWRGSRKDVMLGAMVFALLFAPWPMRNARVFHAAIPLRSNLGLELVMGNHDGSDGHLDEALFPSFNGAELANYREKGEVAYMAGKSEAARAWIALHPVAFAALTLKRAAMFWSGAGTRGGSLFFVVHALLTSLLGVLGLRRIACAGHGKASLLLMIPLLLLPLPYYITHAEFRYRLAIDPLLCGLAACCFCKRIPGKTRG